jgi:hypothetical protein
VARLDNNFHIDRELLRAEYEKMKPLSPKINNKNSMQFLG